MANLVKKARSNDKGAARVDMKIEVVVIPVSDVDRAKEFYERLGWRLDADVISGRSHLIQITPPGSASSIQFGENLFGGGVMAAARAQSRAYTSSSPISRPRGMN